MTGKEAAVFAPSGTQTNLIALLSHCQRGPEYIVGHTGHTYMYEGGGAAVLGGIQPNPIPLRNRRESAPRRHRRRHQARRSALCCDALVCLENTQAGKVLPMDYLARYSDLVGAGGLSDTSTAHGYSMRRWPSVCRWPIYVNTLTVCPMSF